MNRSIDDVGGTIVIMLSTEDFIDIIAYEICTPHVLRPRFWDKFMFYSHISK